MDEKIELLISIINKWTNKYAHKIYVTGQDEEKREHYYKVIFFHQNQNEPIPKYKIDAYFIITELSATNLDPFSVYTNNNDKYFVTFKFENETLTRTLDMNLNCEAWIDKLIKDKEKLRGNINLSSKFMKTRFEKAVPKSEISLILEKIKEERELLRKNNQEKEKSDELINENILNKNCFYDQTYELEKINSQTYLNNIDKNDLNLNKKENDQNDKLNEALSFLKSNLYLYFSNADIKKRGKLKHNYYTEILKMINYKLCISYLYFENKKNKEKKLEQELNETTNESDKYFFCDTDEDECLSVNDNSEAEWNDKNKNGEKEDRKYLSNLFNTNNKEINLIKNCDIYINNIFNGFNIFFDTPEEIPQNSNIFIFDNSNEQDSNNNMESYYKYIFTNNYYDFLLYISYCDEEDNGFIYYNNYVNTLPKYLYELKKNRELFIDINFDDLILYKQLIYACYEKELNFLYDSLLFQFKKYDLCDSGYIHRIQFKKILEENNHIISKQEYKLLIHIFHYNDDNYVYYKNIKEVILRLRFEGIRNSIFERDANLLQKYLCEQLVKHNLKNKKKIHIFDCKHVLDNCDKLYLNKNTIHTILCLLDFDKNLELDVNLFLKISITIIISMIKLENMQMIYNIITDDKQKKEDCQTDGTNCVFSKKKTIRIAEKANIPAQELVEITLTKLFKVLDEKNEDNLKIIDFIETLLESNKKKKIIDIKEICKLSKKELQGFVAEIDTEPKKKSFMNEQNKNNRSFEVYKNRKIHYASHIHKWCSKTYQIRSCEYYSHFFNHPHNLVELNEDINKRVLFCEEEKELF
ncbi:conserved Plasmodium protein, unknown function [Plasmodium berghei]|uniref:Uncharacterized protein n=2 Tax=Plasmodium berghei TaxID=5821 RepID=A0A509ANI2_PLABA|nr:conserved Plasmodium protein, unknown function [Plasmodium berghei ANKA]SCM24813.1 conserved Plasmodium protein, unknown function [Plasmodium berghei]SCN27176.1 conserved Plasmodium protein, unknown function [Plasmodium berghei]SCO63599.1 conserved Plasmodium protein, unknown function [Plasmodium berghei]VUC57031.1 conserved Plasmodium protein, unknown function [Plasmodium berghei ANKA]|eukprot:XP_034422810.1 conserved Plasmodium protein, unknown function [Plasmodium berghei ANKA]